AADLQPDRVRERKAPADDQLVLGVGHPRRVPARRRAPAGPARETSRRRREVDVTASAAGVGGGLLNKGLAALQLVADRGSVTVGEVGSGVGLSRSTAYRLVDRLRTAGYLQESSTPGAVRLGPLAVRIGLAALNQLGIMDVAPARLAVLAQEAGETVNLGIPQRDEIVYVYQAEGPAAVKVTARLGTRRPLTCSALGKAYLAALPPDERDKRLPRLTLVRLTKHSIVDAAAFGKE